MAFTTYIFREDLDRLKKDASRGSAGGSLYGQLTSTGNPVVHVAFSESGPQKKGIETFLSETYKLCHIGEWIAGKQHPRTRQGLLQKYKGHGRPSRFVVLEVAGLAEVIPFLFVEHDPEKEGKVDELRGENPFNREDVLKQSIVGYKQRNPAEQHYNAGGGFGLIRPQPSAEWQGGRYQPPPRARPQGQEARTLTEQWYASEEGEKRLKDVLEKMKEITQSHTKVQMARDTYTHDVTLSFTDRFNKKCEVKFPPSFPHGGALVTIKSLSRTGPGYPYETSSSSYGNHAQKCCQIPGCDSVDKVVADIKYCIQFGGCR